MYSLRSFARDLDLSACRLSEIFNNKQGLSGAKAKTVGEKLGMSKDQLDYFCTQVESQHARSKVARDAARIRLSKFKSNADELSLEYFRIIEDWYHFAILELTNIKGFVNEIPWIAKRLGITEIETEMAIKRLKDIGLLTEVRGKLKKSRSLVRTPSDIPSESIKRYHEQVLRNSLDALYFQEVEDRDFGSINFMVTKKQIPKLKEKIAQFRRELMHDCAEAKGRDRLYSFSTQLIRLDRETI